MSSSFSFVLGTHIIGLCQSNSTNDVKSIGLYLLYCITKNTKLLEELTKTHQNPNFKIEPGQVKRGTDQNTPKPELEN